MCSRAFDIDSRRRNRPRAILERGCGVFELALRIQAGYTATEVVKVHTSNTLTFGTQILGDLDAGSAREWLVPDGVGGFAMGTACGLRTRRYHALLVVADARLHRNVGLVALDPVIDGVRLGTHEWADGTVAPRGHAHLERFELVNGLPSWQWRLGQTVIRRELAMRQGSPCVAVVDRLLAGGPADYTLEAWCAWRDQHGEQPPAAYDDVMRHLRLRGPGWTPDGTWMRGVHHRAEAARGYTPNEDLLLSGRFHARLERPGDALEVTCWAGDLDLDPEPAPVIIERAHRRNAAFTPLQRAADAFIVRGPEVVAGYPWFGAWSRDTMTSYEGLFLCTGRFDEGRELLRAYAATLSEGMLVNTAGEFNTADATLWFVHAIDRHVTVTGDTDLLASLKPALDGILKAHLDGTRYGIRVDPADGLLVQGAAGEALTWMDARVDGVPVTPRSGKAIEINALWCNALAVLGSDLHGRAVTSFRRVFADGRDTADDPALRPNQLLAYSLPHAPLAPEPLGRLDPLLTPLGLRTLAPGDPAYRGRHEGTMRERDLAYHQGTVWPWLIGPYATAAKKAGTLDAGLFDGLMAHLGEWGLGSVSETCHGDAPHGATGCPFQAWSVAELLRSQSL